MQNFTSTHLLVHIAPLSIDKSLQYFSGNFLEVSGFFILAGILAYVSKKYLPTDRHLLVFVYKPTLPAKSLGTF